MPKKTVADPGIPKRAGEGVGTNLWVWGKIFVKNCMKVRGGECGSLAPLGSANAKRFKTTNVFGLLQLRTFEVGTLSVKSWMSHCTPYYYLRRGQRVLI